MTAPTTRTLAEAEAEYAALENKRSPEGHELREEIKALKGSAGTPPTSGRPIAPDLSRDGQAEKTAPYWVGICPLVPPGADKDAERPPFTFKTLAGVTFSLGETPWEGPTHVNPDHKRGFYPGSVIHLTAEQVENLRDALSRSIVRWHNRTGAHAHGYLVTFMGDEQVKKAKQDHGLTDAQANHYKQKMKMKNLRDTDEPAAKYFYCVKLDHDVPVGSNFRPQAGTPASILDVGGIEAP